MLKLTAKRAIIAMAVIVSAPTLWAGDYLFTSVPYLKLTKKVAEEAAVQSKTVFGADSTFGQKFQTVKTTLVDIVDATQQRRLQKKIKPDAVTDEKDKAFADALNAFKDGLNAMSQKAGQSLSQLLPSYDKWNRLEADVVKTGLDKRLAAFETRFGPDSEQINIVELLIAEKFLPGTEAGPSAWEPILRFNAVQVTSRDSSLTSNFELGSNYYFLRGAPKPLALIGVTNHVGVAATLQYLDDPGVFDFKGRPAFGVVLHLDRKELGVAWDNEEDKFRVTLGYSFQFVPFLF